MHDLVPVILSGGSGTRLWPVSRTARPKQFLNIVDDTSLFQGTLARLRGVRAPGAPAPVIVANDSHRFLVGEQCREIGETPSAIVLEPVARNTAPAIVVGALAAMDACGPKVDPVLLVLPSDHVIRDEAAFHDAVRVGYQAAQQGALVTFGILPLRPETGYGYIKGATRCAPGAAAPVASFVEKPCLEVAEAYVRDGSYFWNSGMFMFKASSLLGEVARLCPKVADASQAAWAQAKRDLEFIRLDTNAFGANPSDSIDYAVMERTDRAVVVPLDAGWSDVGAWDAVAQVRPGDGAGNASRGEVVMEDTRNSYVHAEGRMVALVGVDDLVVVETADAVLVTRKDKTQEVKRVVDRLKTAGRPEVTHHREVFRPWGSYDSVDHGDRFQVKRITVRPGNKLSVQMHFHRAEHWVVVSGTAKVRVDDQERLVTENESIYIPLGAVHSLENPGKMPLHLVEVQSGSYLGEDDIVRFEDRYGRA